MLIMRNTIEQSFMALKIALNYALARKQFGSPEKPIIDYSGHQVRLLPLYAQSLVYFIASRKMKKIWHENLPNLLNEKNKRSELCHGLSSVGKAIHTWHA